MSGKTVQQTAQQLANSVGLHAAPIYPISIQFMPANTPQDACTFSYLKADFGGK